MTFTPILRITHKLTAINSPTPLLLKARDSSNMIPAYPITNSNAIARSCREKSHRTTNFQNISYLYLFANACTSLQNLAEVKSGKMTITNLISSHPRMVNCYGPSCSRRKNGNCFKQISLGLVVVFEILRACFINWT